MNLYRTGYRYLSYNNRLKCKTSFNNSFGSMCIGICIILLILSAIIK